MSATKTLGDLGEELTVQYLRERGYAVLDRQWRCRYGELDVVARDLCGVVCFVEVKLRSGTAYGLPREFVGGRKREKLRKTALAYLSAHNLDACARFDVAEVYWDKWHDAFRLEYLEDAFW